MKKIVVLNSGGFDSTVLLTGLAISGKYEIYSLYFEYGQLNNEECKKIAEENANKLGAKHYNISLPTFSWTNSDFFKEGVNEYETQYLEMRNMVFISYAMSLADSVGAKSIFAAILGNGQYKDTNAEFINAVQNLCNTIEVSFETPFVDCTKEQLFVDAKMYQVGKVFKYFSCDTPENGNPCGECFDCKELKYYERILKDELPVMQYFTCDMDARDKEFQRKFKEHPIHEMRVNLNNECQLDCEHCYHANNPLIQTELSDEELFSAIDQAHQNEIKSIHFAGKEPLYNDRIFTIAKYIRDHYSDMVYSVVSNGINTIKYIDQIAEIGFEKVFLTISDAFSESQTRPNNVNKVIEKAVSELVKRGVPVQLFYDLTPNSIKNTIRNIIYWNENFGVKEFHVRTIRLVGNAENIKKVSLEDLNSLHEMFMKIKGDLHIEFAIGAFPYVTELLESGEVTSLSDYAERCAILGNTKITDSYTLYTELYCSRYENQITLTADGYVLGCAMECSEKCYDKISSGNIRDTDLKHIIEVGKEMSLKVNENHPKNKCIFSNPIDK